MNHLTRFALATFVAALMLGGPVLSPAALAANGSWNVDAAGNWTTAGSWLDDSIPGSTSLTNSADIATFGFPLTAARTVTVDANRNIGGITFSNESNFGYTLSGGNLLLSSTRVIQTAATNGAHTDTISTAIAIQGNGGSATFTAGATNASSLLSIGGGVTGVSTTGNTTLTLNGGNTGLNTISGVIGDGGGGGRLAIVKSGAGRWVLSGANTYTGNTTLNGGRLDLNSTTAIGTGPLVIAGGTLGNTSGAAITLSSNNTQNWNNNFSFAGPYDLNLGTGAVVIDATSRTVTVSSNTLSVGGAISGGNSATAFTKAGAGTLSLGAANTYSGGTGITGGTLVLDYSTQNNSKLSDTTVLTLEGGGLVIKGGSHTETVGSTRLNAGGSTISRDGGTGVMQLNAFNRTVQSTLVFGEASIATTDTLNVNGILGGWATIGNDWAVNNTNAADGAITALSSYTGALPTATGSTAANYTLTGDQTQTGLVDANTLKITGSGTLQLNSNILKIRWASHADQGGILYAGGPDDNYTIANGRVQSTFHTTELIFQANSGTLTVNAFVIGSHPTSASGPVTKNGAGTLVLGAANNFTGAVRVNQGTLRLTNATAAGTTAGGITVQNGAALELANAIAVGAEALTLNGSGISNAGALRNLSGSNTYGGLVTLGMNSRINSDAGTLNLTNAGTITGAGFGLTFGGAGDTSLSSIIGTGAGTLTKDGAGTLTLLAVNTYTGTTTVSAGTLVVNGSLAAASSVLVEASGTLGGTGTINGATTILGAHTPGNSPGIQTFASDLTYSGGNSTVQWELIGNTTTNQPNPDAIFDQIIVGGNLDFAGSTTLSLSFNGTGSAVNWNDSFWSSNQSWTLYDVAGTTSNFGNLSINVQDWADGQLVPNLFNTARPASSFSLSQDGQNVILNYVAVPEPRAIALAGLGLAAAAFASRRRRRCP